MNTVLKCLKIVLLGMALFRYFKPANGLPHPKGTLSSVMSPEIITEMNTAVEEANCSPGKRGRYKTYSLSERFQIGKYASQHGATAAP